MPGENQIVKQKKNLPRVFHLIPEDILNDKQIQEAISLLPENYNFEVYKCIWQLRKNNAKRVALQFPEGLLMYACILSDIFKQFAHVQTLIMGDVTYGACCIDDYTAKALNCDFMIHYGHSCLVPVSTTTIKTLYVFVDIGFDISHFVETVKHNFGPKTLAKHAIQMESVDEEEYDKPKIALTGTVQFISSLPTVKKELSPWFDIQIPQIKPLSPGELLGCTAPKLDHVDFFLYLGDGRFHLEAAMIANPTIPAYRYDPYSKKLTREGYDHDEMKQLRKRAVEQARYAQTFGIILGTLGRQGNPKILDYLKDSLTKHGKKFVSILLSEIMPGKLEQFNDIDCFVQIACPRLSIDWGYAFSKPLLTPYECAVVLNMAQGFDDNYPMDFYAKKSLGPWTPNHEAS